MCEKNSMEINESCIKQTNKQINKYSKKESIELNDSCVKSLK